MSSFEFRIDLSNLKNKVKDLQNLKDTVMPQAYKKFVQITPIDTGNARLNTRLVGDEIHADYPYASKLDDGYSKQAPDGMSAPVTEFIKDEVAKQIKKIGSK